MSDKSVQIDDVTKIDHAQLADLLYGPVDESSPHSMPNRQSLICQMSFDKSLRQQMEDDLRQKILNGVLIL